MPLTSAPELLLGIYTTRCDGGNGAGLERFLPPARTTFYGYGRQALADGLCRLGVVAGDTVLLPGLVCREVLASLSSVGAVPRFFEVDETLRTDVKALERAATGTVRAVVAVNYFGLPQPLEPFRAWCEAHGAALVEDNAHGFLSSDRAIPLGQRGDLGIFSLRKTLALPNGAALVDNRRGAAATASEDARWVASPHSAERHYRCKIVLKTLIGLGGLRGARAVITAVRFARLALTGSAVPAMPLDGETRMPREALAPLSRRLLARCDWQRESERRRQLYRHCQELFADVREIHPLFGDLVEGVTPQGFPFLYTGDDPAALVSAWWRRGVPITRWPDLPEALRLTAPSHYRRVMVVPFLW